MGQALAICIMLILQFFLEKDFMQKIKLLQKFAFTTIVATAALSNNSVLAAGIATVSNSAQLIGAINNLTIDSMVFSRDIVLDDTAYLSLQRNFTIDGGGYTLFGPGYGFELSDDNSVGFNYVINNLNFNGLSEGICWANTKSLIINNCNFMNNAYDGPGAAIDNNGNITFNGTSNFTNNRAGSNGGAINNNNYNNSGSIIIFSGASNFANNIAGGSGSGSGSGGAIYNSKNGNVAFNDAANFTNNIASARGGVIENNGVINFNNTVSFAGNSANIGGAIDNWDSGQITFNGISNFTNNMAGDSGGAIYNDASDSAITFNADTMFTGNKAINGAGGAISNLGNITFNGISDFASNSAGSVGGAIHNGYDGKSSNITFNKAANFTNNSVKNTNQVVGGAILNDISGNIIFNGTSDFIGNSASASGGEGINAAGGGAIFNVGNMIFNDISSFTGNSVRATSVNNFAEDEIALGGAIANIGNITFNNSSYFTNNSARASSGYGGAIYNGYNKDFGVPGTINFNADAIFSNNTDSTGSNDIYNNGTVNINAGTMTIGGGIGGFGTLNVNKAILNLGASNINQAAVNFASNSILDLQYANPNTTRIATNTNLANIDSQFMPVNPNIIVGPTINTGAKIIINKAGDYQLFSSSPASGNVFSNLLYSIKDANGRYAITSKNPQQIINDTKTSTGVMLGTNDAKALVSLDNLNYNAAKNQVVNIFKGAQIGDTALLNQVKHLTYSSAATTQAIATGSQNSIIDITGRRVSLINETKPGTAPWMQLIYNHKKQNTTGDNPGFFSNTKGAAVGVDKTTTDYMLGLGYAYNDTNLSSNGTDTDADGHNIFTYAHYQLNHNWFVNGVVNAGFSGHYDENPLRNAKHNVNAYGGQVLTGYDLAGLKSAKYDLSGLKPELGVRYIYINTGSYTDSIGTKFNLNNINVLTGFLGGVYGREFAGKNNKFTITPEVKLGATYDVVSSNQDGTVTILGAANSYTATTNKLPKFGMEAGIGATIHVQQFYITLNYDAFKRKDYLSQTGMLKLKCEL